MNPYRCQAACLSLESTLPRGIIADTGTRDAPILAVLEGLRAISVTVAFDDFGTGFSSLSSLLRFPFDNLKIDRSFVAGTSESAAAIVRAIIGLALNLGLATTGEGVETPEHLAMLKRLGCTQAQGYLFSRPQPNSEVPRLLRELGAACADNMVEHIAG
jgi:EAL domain-containing protein (putative c-di-GMP-specific phosphodiesterase class I)